MLDVAGHLTSFGWKGHGTALRDGAITRPLLVSQKKSLSGLGKDRDEAFPFWDQYVASSLTMRPIAYNMERIFGRGKDYYDQSLCGLGRLGECRVLVEWLKF